MINKKELSFESALKVLGGRRVAGFGDKAEALAKYLDMDFSEVSPYGGNPKDNRFVTPEGTYLVLTFDEAVNEAEENILEEFRNYGLNSYFNTRARDTIIENLDRNAMRSILDERVYHLVENGEMDEDDFEYNLNKLSSDNYEAIEFLEDEYGMSDADLAEDLLSSGAIDPHTLASLVVEELGAGGYIEHADEEGESSYEDYPNSKYYFYRLNI